MHLTIDAPPRPTGYFKGDIQRTTEWLDKFRRTLINCIECVENNNIRSINADKLRGVIDITKIDAVKLVSNGKPVIDIGEKDGEITLRIELGEDYIKYDNGRLHIKAADVVID